MPIRRCRALLLLAALQPLPAVAGDLFPPEQLARIHEGLRDIYNLDHERAAANFERMIADSPDDPAGYAYLATTLWRRELSEKQELSIDRFAASDFFAEKARPLGNVDPVMEARFRQLSEEAITRAKRRLSRTADDKTSLFLLGLTYQNLASFEVSLKRNWWAAFRYGTRAYGYNRDLSRDPQFYDARLAIGVYTYVAGSLGWSVRWLALLMGYRGSQERGKQELEMAARQGQLAADDARVILVLIHTREHDYQRAYSYLAELLKKYPRNYLLQLDMAGMALLMKNPDQAISTYQDILRKHEALQPNYQKLERAALYNRLGVAFRARNDLSASSDWFRRALAQPTISVNAATLAHLELGKTLDLMGRRADAIAQYRIAAAAPDFAGSRQEAQRLLHPHVR
ncbi:MAG: tetratricopeptide repeat protein [Acidobacteriia bacterium]|nr:tetratricopeptide repeat protein [Terriglobia bacterium]